ncbi:hypothetical protein U1Q18_014912 [Sarracenia purpurea var. burkii]
MALPWPLDFAEIEDVSEIVKASVSGDSPMISELRSMKRTLRSTKELFEQLKKISLHDGDSSERVSEPLKERNGAMKSEVFYSSTVCHVPIDIKIGCTTKIVVISRPNIGGKTASMKTLGLASVMSKLYKILEVASKESLVLIDEIGGRTDPSERVALVASILQYLKDRANLAVVTTHYADLTSLKEGDTQLENAAMEFSLKTLKPTYKVIWGGRGDSDVMYLYHEIAAPPKMASIAAAARPLVSVQNLESDMATDGASNILPLPSVMTAPIRPDIVRHVHSNMAKNSRQPYAVSKKAGHQTSAES